MVENITARAVECHSPCHGEGRYIEEYDVFACNYCGSISYSENLYRTNSGTLLLSGGDEDDFVRVVGRVCLDDMPVGPMAIIKSPYEAKRDIKKLDFRTTERRWSDEVNHWVMRTSYLDTFVEHMRESGWKVLNLLPEPNDD